MSHLCINIYNHYINTLITNCLCITTNVKNIINNRHLCIPIYSNVNNIISYCWLVIVSF